MDVTMIGSGIINSIKPFCKKHVITSLDPHEFIFLNTFLITSILLIYFIYLSVYEKYNIYSLYNKYSSLSKSQIIAISGLSLITLSSTFIGLSSQKNQTSNVKNNLIMKSMTTILIIIIGIYMFEEEYTKFDIFGIILILCGIYLINT
jgi:multidrug transporter EmrE-like cation transporter